MGHPFFNAITYPFQREDAKQLHKVLSQAEKNSARIQNIYERCGSNLPPLTLPAAADLVWNEVLGNLAKHGVLQNLCTYIKNQFAGQPIIVDAVVAVENAIPASERKILSNGVFILDCEDHREAISKITEDITPKVLLIRGKEKSGKTHCRFIFQSIAEEKGATVVYLCDGIVATVNEAMESIFSALGAGAEKIPAKVSTEDAWYRAVCNKLKELATTGQTKKIWVVADDLGYIKNVPILDKEIRCFFEQFALFMQDPSFAKYFRLLMVNYAEQAIPTKWKATMWAEVNTDENTIQQTHVEDFLKDWKLEEKSDILEQDLKSLAQEVITIVTNPPANIASLSRLERIHYVLSFKLDEIKRRAS
jgi:hypothetical protein